MALGAALAIAGISSIGSIIGGNRKAHAAEDAVKTSTATQKSFLNQGLQGINPYLKLGGGSIEALQGFQSQQGRADLLNSYYAGPEFRAQESQITEGVLRGLNASGGLRSGAAPAAISRIAPSLGSQYLNDTFQQNFGLAGLGVNAANSALNANINTGANIAGVQANGINAAGQARAGIASDVTGSLLNFANTPGVF